MDDPTPTLKQNYQNAGQLHLLNHLEQLRWEGNMEEYRAFLDQLQRLSNVIQPLVDKFHDAMHTQEQMLKRKHDGPTAKKNEIEPLPKENCKTAVNGSPEWNAWKDAGLNAIAKGEVGIILMAGGQGTRLGSKNPKGMYDLNLPSGKSLFQIQAERIRRLQEMAGENAIIPWYIMTSGKTEKMTRQYFEEHNYFGLDIANVRFFEQNQIPAFSFDGKSMLEDKYNLALSPDGNGGLFEALDNNGILLDIENRVVKYLHVYSVDNILVKIADPVFIGCCIVNNAPGGAKVVPKDYPTEPVGVFAMKNGQYQVVEYSELSQELAEKTDADGQLLYNAGNIANHFFHRDFLIEIVNHHLSKLQYHIAKKKIPYYDSKDKAMIHPTEPNGIKLELFVFDVFQFAKDMVVLSINRKEEFSPLKNASGAKDSTPETCKADLLSLHRRYMENAGATLLPNPQDGGVIVEISPLVSYHGEGLEVAKGKTYQSPLVINTVDDLVNKAL